MLRQVCLRFAETLPLLFLLTLLVFGLFQLVPGDYLSELEMNPTISRESIADLRSDLGLDRSLPEQYLLWVSRLVTGDLGYSFAQRRPAFDLIVERLWSTLYLGTAAFLMILALGIPTGVLAALRLGGWVDRLVLTGALIGLSLPSVLAAVGLLYLAYTTGWFPIGGSGSLRHLFLPSLALALPAAGFFARTTRLEMAHALQQPFVLAAAARGLPPSRVVWQAFRYALNPLLSLAGLTLGGLLSGAVVVEKVFAWPGIGSLTVDSILNRDLYVVLNCVLLAALLVILANLGSELLMAWNDPRMRRQ